MSSTVWHLHMFMTLRFLSASDAFFNENRRTLVSFHGNSFNNAFHVELMHLTTQAVLWNSFMLLLWMECVYMYIYLEQGYCYVNSMVLKGITQIRNASTAFRATAFLCFESLTSKVWGYNLLNVQACVNAMYSFFTKE